mmetsp:Transcript_27040/g.75922  ORF Transcript_27040/g.75922 Transcript_27040/m.75922 type:complete len:264 (+) Transcript_27040:820-1611(+)
MVAAAAAVAEQRRGRRPTSLRSPALPARARDSAAAPPRAVAPAKHTCPTSFCWLTCLPQSPQNTRLWPPPQAYTCSSRRRLPPSTLRLTAPASLSRPFPHPEIEHRILIDAQELPSAWTPAPLCTRRTTRWHGPAPWSPSRQDGASPAASAPGTDAAPAPAPASAVVTCTALFGSQAAPVEAAGAATPPSKKGGGPGAMQMWRATFLAWSCLRHVTQILRLWPLGQMYVGRVSRTRIDLNGLRGSPQRGLVQILVSAAAMAEA